MPRFVYLLAGVHEHINHIIKGKLPEAIAQLNEKSIVLKRILQNGLFLYQMPMHRIIVLCRNLAWDKSQEVATAELAYT